MQNTSESLSYPIGRHTPQPSYDPSERSALIERLDAQPWALAEAIRDLPEADLEQSYRPGGWTVRQVVHHLADSHVNMYIRVRFALTEAEPTIMPYDENDWAHLADVTIVSPEVSVAMVAALHARLVALLRALTPQQFARTLMHPDNGRMSVEQVMALYAWHGDHHIAHIRSVRDRKGQ